LKLARLPPPVAPGSRVGVAAVSGPVDGRRLERGLTALVELGFEPVLAPNLATRFDLFAGPDEARLSALYELVDDPGLAAIFLARGGYGLTRLLPSIDWDRLGAHPRAWIGYSDATPLLNGLVERCRMVTFHGPMVAADLARGLSVEERDSLLAALRGELPLEYRLRSSSTGSRETVEGETAGGCLSLLAACIGTPYATRFEGKILILEDVEEPSYRIDRMLTHLALSGSLTGVRGIALGDLRGRDEPSGEGSIVGERVRSAAPSVPVVEGLAIGHRAPNLTVPLGLRARLDPTSGLLLVGLSGSTS